MYYLTSNHLIFTVFKALLFLILKGYKDYWIVNLGNILYGNKI
jgi:hypothetical protein